MTATNNIILESIVQRFLNSPKSLNYGAGKMAIRWKTTRQIIEKARSIAREKLKANTPTIVQKEQSVIKNTSVDFTKNQHKLEAVTYNEPKDVEEIQNIFKLDLSKFEIQRYWSSFNGSSWKVTVDVKRIKDDDSVEAQASILLDSIKKYSPKVSPITYKKINGEKYLLELSTAELHIGKLAHEDETGEDYDIKIAEKRFKDSISSLLSRINLDNVEKILFVVGNDFINVDNYNSTTTAGTPQSTDSRFHKMINAAKRIVINTVDSLIDIAPVDIVIVTGNHDKQTTFLLGHIIEAFYYNNPNVSVNNEPTQRKYYKYKSNSIQLTHGNEEKHQDLGLIFATEKPTLWASTKYRFCQLGHFHKNKTINYVSVDEHQGFQIQVLPSLSGTDSWHNSKGYMSKKQNKAFLFSEKDGLIAEYTYTN
jgi:hypothetical protein